MTVGVELTARLIVVMTLIHYSFGATTDLPPITASNTTVASSTSLATMSKTDGLVANAGVTDFLMDDDDTVSSGCVSDISTTASTDSNPSFTGVYSTHSPLAESTSSTTTPAELTLPADAHTSVPSSSEFTSIEETSTEASTASPSPPTSTSTPTTTTTQTPPAGYLEPDFGAAPPFEIAFSIGFQRQWDDSFHDCFRSQVCLDFQYKVQTLIDIAFIGCPGYVNGSIVVVKFYPDPPGAREVLQLADTTDGNATDTYASYNAYFDSEVILFQGADVEIYIDTVVEKKLANHSLVIDESVYGMEAVAKDQVTTFNQNPCPSIGKAICPAFCYPCVSGDTVPNGIGCLTPCNLDDGQTCTIDVENNITCKCKDNYLPVGGDCVHENWIIGISAGVGGAILVALLIASIVLGCKLNKKEKQYDNLVESQQHRPDAYEMVLHVDSIEDAIHKTNGADLHDRETHAVDDAETELVTFSRSDNEALPSIAEAAIVAAEAADEEHHHQQQHQHQHEVDAKQMEIKYESPVGSNPEAAADYDAVSTSSLTQHQPGPSTREPDIKQSDYYRSLYYAIPDSGQKDPYDSFKPQLINIDANKEYVIKRPKLQPPNTNHYDYTKSYF